MMILEKSHKDRWKQMETQTYNLLNVGVGGQGVIRAVEILAWAALADDNKVRTAETHGMAQRGGSVISYLRFGKKVEGPLIPRGEANVILAFEASEAVRYLNYAGPNTIFLVNTELLVPPTNHKKGTEYPSIGEIKNYLTKVSKNIYFIDANELAMKAGNIKTVNVIMLGVLFGSKQLPITKQSLENAIMEFVPKKAIEVNKKAFELGIEKGISIREGK